MSARPGLCGGHRVTGVPTAIDSYPFIKSAKGEEQAAGITSELPIARELSNRAQRYGIVFFYPAENTGSMYP